MVMLTITTVRSLSRSSASLFPSPHISPLVDSCQHTLKNCYIASANFAAGILQSGKTNTDYAKKTINKKMNATKTEKTFKASMRLVRSDVSVSVKAVRERLILVLASSTLSSTR
jgi:hypothetical protein